MAYSDQTYLTSSVSGTASIADPPYSFLLQSGRGVWIDAFHFEKTYTGLMVGYPNNDTGYITRQVEKAEAMWMPGACLTIPPSTILREGGDRRYVSWPTYCCKAWLRSENISRNDAFSQLIVIWFIEAPAEVGLVTMIEQACCQVDWDRHAKGWKF